MADDTSSTKSEELLTAEELQLVLDAGHELAKIAVALDEFEIAARNEDSLFEDSQAMFNRLTELYGARIYRSLVARRQELREMLLDLR